MTSFKNLPDILSRKLLYGDSGAEVPVELAIEWRPWRIEGSCRLSRLVAGKQSGGGGQWGFYFVVSREKQLRMRV